MERKEEKKNVRIERKSTGILRKTIFVRCIIAVFIRKITKLTGVMGDTC